MVLSIRCRPNLRRRSSLSRLAFVALVAASAICSLTRAKAFAHDIVRPSPPSVSSQNPLKFFRSSSRRSILQTRGGARASRSSSTSRGVAKVVFDNTPLWQSQHILAGVNLLGFMVSLGTASQLHLDLLGTGAFAAAALPPLLKGGTLERVKRSSLAVTVWGVKLALFLFYRVINKGHDRRLDDVLSSFGGTATFWFVSFIWGAVCSLPHTLGTTSSAAGNKTSLLIGTIMYVVGILTETLADGQKWAFKRNNPGKFCNVGLWSISQHPNFFGNLMLWAGILVMNAPALIEPVPKDADLRTKILCFKRLGLALLSPLFMWNLFSGQAEGSFSNSMDLANSKYGNDPNYRAYINSVPLIVPNPFKKFTPVQ